MMDIQMPNLRFLELLCRVSSLSGTLLWFTSQATASPTVIKNIPIGIALFGVAVNPVTNRIYVTDYGNSFISGTQLLDIIDGSTNAVIKKLPITLLLYQNPVNDLAVNPATNKIYETNTDQGIQVIDGTSNKIKGTIPVTCSTGVAVNPVTNRIYATCDSDNQPEVYAIDGKTDTLLVTTGV